MTYEPVPQRLSDADRDQAVDCLRQHYEAGRLDDAEFDDRSTRALQARIAPDIDALFGDLPDPRPALGDGGQRPPPNAGRPPYPTRDLNPPLYQALSWRPAHQPPQVPAPYTPGGYNPGGSASPDGYPLSPYDQGGVPEQRIGPPTWLRTARVVVWPVAILGGLIVGDFGIWIMLAVVATIVLSQLGARTRRPPS